MTVFTANATLHPGGSASKVLLTLSIQQNKPKLSRVFQSTRMSLLQEKMCVFHFSVHKTPVPHPVSQLSARICSQGWAGGWSAPRPGNCQPLNSPAALAILLHFNVGKVLGTNQGLLSTPALTLTLLALCPSENPISQPTGTSFKGNKYLLCVRWWLFQMLYLYSSPRL